MIKRRQKKKHTCAGVLLLGEMLRDTAAAAAVHHAHRRSSVNLTFAQADFDAMAAHQMDRGRKVTGALTFNDVSYAGVEVKVHGGQHQRRGVDKPSFRLKWSGDDRFGDKHGDPFSFPATGCNNMEKMVLRGEWNDYPMANQGLMIRNKLTQDLIKRAGGQTPRVEFAVVKVNGAYFGFYSLEERVSEQFFECMGWDVAGSSLYKAASPMDGTKWLRRVSQASRASSGRCQTARAATTRTSRHRVLPARAARHRTTSTSCLRW